MTSSDSGVVQRNLNSRYSGTNWDESVQWDREPSSCKIIGICETITVRGASGEAADKIKSEMDAQRDAHSPVLQGVEGREAEQAQLVAEQEDPRNKENWGAGGVVKELQSAFLGGLQDTASCVVSAPERLID